MTTTALPKVERSGGLESLAPILQLLQGSMGTGKTTTESKGTLDPGVNAQADELLKTILGQNDSGDLDKLIGSIMARAKQEFAPVLGQSAAAGERAYSSTSVKSLANEAVARATGEAAAAKLNFINKNNALATQLVDTKMNATAGKTGTSVTGASPLGKAIGYVTPALAAYNQFKKATEKDKPSIPNPTSIKKLFQEDPTGALYDPEAAGSIADSFPVSAMDTGISEFTNAMSTTGFDEILGSLGISASAGAFDSLAGFSASFGDSLAFGGAASAGAEGAALGAGAAAGAYVVPVIAALEGISGGAISEGVTGFENDFQDAFGFDPDPNPILSELGTGYICAELQRQGIISNMDRARVYIKFQKILSPETIKGYRFWSRYFIKLMQRSKSFTWLGERIFHAWLGQVSKKPSAFGFFMHYAIRPVSFVIGLVLTWRENGYRRSQQTS